MAVRRLLLALSLLAVSIGGSPASGSPTPGFVPSYCRATENGYRCLIGPFDVGAGETRDIVTGVAAPSEAGYITAARPRLVDGDGDRVGHHAVHLHHAVWLNPYEDDMTCESYDRGSFPDYERFFATGKELTKVVFPEGYGYRWDPQVGQPFSNSAPWWAFTAHLDGMHGSSEVYVELDMDFIPANEADGLTNTEPVWLDVRNCRSEPVYDVPKRDGIDKESWTYRMPVGGRFVFLGGHLHDGGLRLSLDNVTAGDRLFTSRPTYGWKSEPWALTKMSTWSGRPGIAVGKGDKLRLTSIYDASRRWNDVMGIMVGALAPKP